MKNDDEAQHKTARRVMIDAAIARIKAENEANRAERNARRWKAERDPLEYARQKERQREDYADQRGGSVRSYEKIVGQTPEEREAEKKSRHAKRGRDSYANMTDEERQDESDRKAEAGFIRRRRAKGMTEEVIQAELILYIAERAEKRAAKAQEEDEDAAMRDGPNFGIF